MKVSPGRTSDAASWWLIGGMAAAGAFACHGLGFRVDRSSTLAPGIGLAILCAGMIAGARRGRPRLRAGSVAFFQMTAFTLLGVVLAYALAARGGPLWDDALAAADRRLGLDWPALCAIADASPAALWIGGLAYHSLTVQMIVCIVVLSVTGRIDRLRSAVAAAILAGFVTVAISGAMPAVGNLFDPAAYRRLWPSVAWLERDMIAGLRDGSWRTLDLTRLMGIVSFPSYHATLPVILAWAQRRVRGWRIVVPAWAGVTIIATPLFGGHYGVDVLAGLALAAVALAAAPYLVLRRRLPTAACPPAPPAGLAPAGDEGQLGGTGSGVCNGVV